MDTSVTTNDGTQERAAQTMPGRDELRDAIGRVVALHKSEYDWYDDPGAVVEERITGVLSEIERDHRIIAAERWERVREVAERSACIQRHKAEVFGRDTVSLPEVEQLNEHLKAIYAQLDAAYLRLQPGDLDPAPTGGE